MNKKHAMRSICFATILSTIISNPVAASMVWLGSVYLQSSDKKPLQFDDFGGGVARLGFRASNSDVACNDIRATFRDGTTYDAFQGWLAAGDEADVALPEGKDEISTLNIQCTGNGLPSAAIDVLVDPGTHMQEWRSSPNWNSTLWYRF